MTYQSVVDLIMTRNRLFHSISRIDVNIVSRTMSKQFTPVGSQLLDQVFAFHMRIPFI